MTAPPDAERLLGAVAEALNACQSAGIDVKLKHGAVMTEAGYVLPIGDGWVARTRTYTEFAPASGDDDDE